MKLGTIASTHPRTILGSLALFVCVTACASEASTADSGPDASNQPDAVSTADAMTADGSADAALPSSETPFFYQDVSASNAVRVGVTKDGKLVDSYDTDVLSWKALSDQKVYGDPVFSRLSNGKWAMTARSGAQDPRGSFALMYHEASCPKVVDADVKVIRPSSGGSCKNVSNLVMGKVSQVFDVDGSNYIFSMISSEIYLIRLSDKTHSALDLSGVCVRSSPAKTFADLAWGEATVVIDKTAANGRLLGDTAIARRKDGTWTLFVKSIQADLGCVNGSLCELCARSIYRTTSSDLISWSPMVKLVDKSSVPEAVNYPDGSLWLYWQTFTPACEAQDLMLANRAPISGAFEQADGTLSAVATVKFPSEAFETDTAKHYATNGNPIALPSKEAKSAFDACFGR